jgi:PAS domain S-box-containing protein
MVDTVPETHCTSIEESRRWHEVFYHIAIGVSVTNTKNNCVIIANPAFAAMHGLAPSEVSGVSKYKFFAPAEWCRVDELDAAAARYGHSDYEMDRVRKDGTIFPARIHNTTITVQDITRERQLEAARVHAVEELRR